MSVIRLGFSPCPNDTFLFYALVHGRVDTEGLRFDPVLEDVETLNAWALDGRLPMSKVSYGVVGDLAARYWCLRSGGALGWGCGPLVVAREPRPLDELLAGPVAVPGLRTTACRLLELRAGRPVEAVPMVFHEVMPSVARGEAACGVVIHEGRFTFERFGLVAVEDLGAWWEERFRVPVPLGGIVLRRDAGVDPGRVQRVLRRSVAYALGRPDEPMAYVRAHAQEMDETVMRRHIELYVNGFSLDLGEEGCRAVRTLLHRGKVGETFPRWEGPLFPPEELPGA